MEDQYRKLALSVISDALENTIKHNVYAHDSVWFLSNRNGMLSEWVSIGGLRSDLVMYCKEFAFLAREGNIDFKQIKANLKMLQYLD